VEYTDYLAEAGIRYERRPAYFEMKASVPEFEARLKRQFDTPYREGETVPRVMAIAVHPFVTGQPHRIGALDAARGAPPAGKSCSTTCRNRRNPHLSGNPTRAVLYNAGKVG
jgi:hypothetical protein